MMWQKRFGVELIAVIVMIAVVSVLAAYQYRWTGEISRTEQARLRNSLATSVQNFDREFSYDFQQLCESFELDPEAEPSAIESHAARQQASWTRTSTHADLVWGLYIWKKGSSKATDLEFFNQSENRFQDVNWPSDLVSLRRFLRQRGEFLSSVTDDREAVYYPWTFFGDSPALFRPIFQIVPSGHDSSSGVHTAGILIVALNREYIEREYFSDLVDRHFGAAGQRSFVVSVRTAKAPYQTIYLSDANSPIVADPSAAITCIENVVSNAIKYSNSSKWIAVRAYEASADSKPEVRIAVEDKGIGISSADLAHIFEPFYRVFVEGGALHADLGRGTVVVLHFPVADLADQTE